MAKKMLIDASHSEETRVVVVDGNRVEEFDYESSNRKQLKGNIYLAKVTRVEPSLQAAFIDYGGNRHGFLAFSEIHPDYYQIPVADREALLAAEKQEQREEAIAEDEAGDNPDESGVEDLDEPGIVETDVDETPPETLEGNSVGDEDSADNETDNSENSDDATTAAGEGTEEVAVSAETVEVEASVSEGDEQTEGTAKAAPVEEEPKEPTTEDTSVWGSSVQQSKEFAERGRNRRRNGRNGRNDQSERGEQNARGGQSARGGRGGRNGRGGRDSSSEGRTDNRRRYQRRYKIQEVIKKRQILLIQVVKEERGNKGAALTTYLSMAGRYSVLMPNTGRGGGISRKIANVTDRKRLKSAVGDLDVPEGMGLIIRTAGANRTKAEIKRDYEYLLRLWENVREQTLKSSAPALIYEEGSLTKRSIRDLYDKEIDAVLVEGDEGYKEAKAYMKMLIPSHAKNVQPYREDYPLFQRFQVEAQLDSMFSPVVQLKSGGYIVINPTEALVSVDVNSGRSTREHSIEDTALRTNLEAAEEVARQLRLRDLAGLIVIDFIDMEDYRNNRSVERKIKDKLKSDRARIQISRISSFGLLEMSRQRLRAGLHEGTMSTCPHCDGTGMIKSVESAALSCLRAIEEEGIRKRSAKCSLTVPPATGMYLLNNKRRELTNMEARYRLEVEIGLDHSIPSNDFELTQLIAASARVDDEDDSQVVSLETGFTEDSDDQGEGVEASAAPEESAATGASEEDGQEERQGKRRRRRRKRRDRSEGDETETIETSSEDSTAAVAEEPVDSDAAAETIAEDAPDQPSETEATPEGDVAETVEEKPKRRRRRTKKADEEVAEDKTAADKGTDEKEEKPKRRRRSRKKAEPEALSVAAEVAQELPDRETIVIEIHDKGDEDASATEPDPVAAAPIDAKDKPADETSEAIPDPELAIPEDTPKKETTRKGWWSRG